MDLYQTEAEALKQDEVLARPTDLIDFESPSLVRCNGASFKGGQSLAPLEASLKTPLPEDLLPFDEPFGESVIFTRRSPLSHAPPSDDRCL